MPYSITTRDGITLNDIPDNMPADAPELKQRVAQIRGQSAPKPASDVAAPTSGVAMGFRDPIDAGAQLLRRAVPEPIAQAVDTFGNWLASKGLPVAKSQGVEGVDRIVNEVNEGYEAKRKAAAGGEDPGFDGKRLVGNLINPVNYVGGGAAAGAKTVGQLALAGAKAGAVSGAMQPVVGAENQQEFWTNKAEQAGGGAAAGAVATPLVSKAGGKVADAVGAAVRTARPAPTEQQIKIAITNTFASQGVDPAQVPEVILQSVRRQVDEALQQGQKLNPAAMMRKAQFEAVGLTGDAAPTAGQLSRDAMQFAKEKDLSGVRISTPKGEGNPLAERFSAQNRRLQEVFDRVGSGQATDRVTAGQTLIDALKAADAPVKKGVDDAYAAARAMTGGRAAELDRGAFSQAANKALDDGMWGRFVPENIRGLLNDVTAGKTPFNVDAAEQIDGILSKAQRRAGEGSPEASAIGVIRRALHDAPFVKGAQETGEGAAAAAARTVDDLGAPIVDVPFRPAGGPQKALPAPEGGAVSFQIPQPQPGAAAAAVDEGAAAREAFAQARAAARSRFATIEGTPALKAALDEAAPDKFVQQYVLNANVRDVDAMKAVLANSPEALQQARAQVAEHLKRAAFGENASGDKAFAADRYLQTLRGIGRQKLSAFFSPAEMVQLNLAGKVASDISSVPAGAKPNFSNTGSTVLNLLSRISEAGPLRQIPGMRALANQVGEIKTERAVNAALSPQAAKPAAELSPQARRALELLFTPAGVAGGVLGGAAVN